MGDARRGPLHAVLGTSAALLLVTTAHAAEPRYSFGGTNLLVEGDAGRVEVPIDCKQTFAITRARNELLVACGDQGVAAFDLADPERPAPLGRRDVGGPCFVFTHEGACEATADLAPAATPPPLELVRPRSLEEYDRTLLRLRVNLEAAEKQKSSADAARLRRELRTVRRWRDEDTERNSQGAFVGGLVAVGAGGIAFYAGLTAIAVAELSRFQICLNLFGGTCASRPADSVAVAAGGIMIGAGITTALIGGVAAAIGAPKVMKTEKMDASRARGSTARGLTFTFGPGSVLVGGTF